MPALPQTQTLLAPEAQTWARRSVLPLADADQAVPFQWTMMPLGPTAQTMALLAATGLANPAYQMLPAVTACALVQAVFHPVALLLNRGRHYLAARLYFAGFSVATLSFLAVQLGDRSETSYLVPMVAFAAWLFYRRDEWRWAVMVSLVSVAAFLALSLTADRGVQRLDPQPRGHVSRHRLEARGLHALARATSTSPS